MKPPRPYETPDDARVSRRFARTRGRDTKPELAVRRELHRRGLRYFVDRALLPGLRRRADLVFPRSRVAVYVDGCFFHGCPVHATWPKRNADFWREKIEANRARDRDTDRRLADAGWAVVRAWEHEDPCVVADRVETVLQGVRSEEPDRRGRLGDGRG